jgi:hypothetical protein
LILKRLKSRFTLLLVFANHVIDFLLSLKTPEGFPQSVEVLNPYQLDEVQNIVRQFYQTYYADTEKRVYVWGINPGRHGGGLTGLPFIDPLLLEKRYRIDNSFQKKPELSAGFIHRFIDAFGGERAFYGKFYINSINPLGLIKQGKNFNFYDTPEIYNALKPFIVNSLQTQLSFGANRLVAICLGTGKLQKVTQKLNEEYEFFDEILAVEHPRFIMQYRRKRLEEYLEKYVEVFSRAAEKLR